MSKFEELRIVDNFYQTRNNSNTAVNILNSGRCVLNFVPDDRKYMKNCVRLGFPGDKTEEKMAESLFTLEENVWVDSGGTGDANRWPEVISESYQSFICSWDSELEDAGRFTEQESYAPPYNNFWIAGFKRPYSEAIPEKKGMELDTVKYAADRIDPEIKFSDEACAEMVKVPRIFLKTALNGCADWARENNVSVLTAEHMKIIRDKRTKEKG